jgi:hypothetical protein
LTNAGGGGKTITMKFFQINLQHTCKANTKVLSQRLAMRKAHITLIQKPAFKGAK